LGLWLLGNHDNRLFYSDYVKGGDEVFYYSNITVALIWIVSGLISGFLFIGISKIINLLHQINERQKLTA
jgi:hypothetical protein